MALDLALLSSLRILRILAWSFINCVPLIQLLTRSNLQFSYLYYGVILPFPQDSSTNLMRIYEKGLVSVLVGTQ